jgi:hypothetical protein
LDVVVRLLLVRADRHGDAVRTAVLILALLVGLGIGYYRALRAAVEWIK